MVTAILIPSYQPDRSLLMLAASLQQCCCGTPILIVDDGSGEAYRRIFDTLEHSGCTVIRHRENLGKGAALRTGIRELRETIPDLGGIVTADADGQHLPGDIAAVNAQLSSGKQALILGSRDFSVLGVPFRSRFGNRASSLFFRLNTGVRCPDTQTGLRGIPACLFELALSTQGDRFEYEMAFLTAAVRSGVPLEQLPISVVYCGSGHSHFRTFRDSFQVCLTPVRAVRSAWTARFRRSARISRQRKGGARDAAIPSK